MRLRTLVLALALSCGLSAAAAQHPKPPKAAKHVKPPKPDKHPGAAVKPVKHQSQRAAKHPAGPKVAKHKANKAKVHKG